MDTNHISESSETTLNDLIRPYLRKWLWFVLGVLIAIVIASLYLRYSTPIYVAKATIIIKDEGQEGPLAELASISTVNNLSSLKGKGVEAELSIFNSKRVISEVIKVLNLNVKYQTIGNVKATELYENKPFTVSFLKLNDSVSLASEKTQILIKPLSNTEFSILSNGSETTYKFGELINLPSANITVVPNATNATQFENFIGNEIVVSRLPIELVASDYQSRLTITTESNYSTVVNISLRSPNYKKAEDFIDELIYQYNQDANIDRNQVARKTSNFIDERLTLITEELDSVETGKSVFKSKNQLVDIQAEALIALENASEYDRTQLNVATQLGLANSMIDYVEQSSENEVLPTNIGIDNSVLATQIASYNEIVLQRNTLLSNSTPQNPVVINLNEQISQLKSSIESGLVNTRNNLQASLRRLNVKESSLNNRIGKVPAQEKIYREIERQQTIKEQLFLFLLQKREETSISLAVTAPKAKIVDSAYSDGTPVAPNIYIVYLSAIVVGLLVPFLLLYILLLLDFRISDRKDIEHKIKNIPIVGEIPSHSKKEDGYVKVNDRTVMAEAFRMLRTNLQFMFLDKITNKEHGKVIFVNSSVKGEGKTSVAFNLALTLAMTGKKVCLVGADIRNPQLQRYLPASGKNTPGYTNYIADSSVTIDSLKTENEFNNNLDIYLSGAIPPNPAELLLNPRATSFFDELKLRYDYVIVDTAPSLLVADTLLINQCADVNLYVIRSGYTDKKLLTYIQEAHQKGKITNLALVLNDVSMANYGYGNSYGYGYNYQEESRGNFLQRIFK